MVFLERKIILSYCMYTIDEFLSYGCWTRRPSPVTSYTISFKIAIF